MLKITESIENGKTIRLRLDGTINGTTYGDLDQIFSRHQNRSQRTVIVDMAGIDFMDEESARKIAKRRSERLRLINCSPFIVMLLETVDRTGGL
jgi:anti-anti-sigma regulatory factor